MQRSTSWSLLVAALALAAACGEAPVASDAPAGNAGEPPAAQAEGGVPSGNASWGEPQPEDEASHRGIDFIAFNRTGRTITAVAIRPDEGPPDPGVPENPWSEDVLIQSALPDGQRSAIHFEPDIELCTWQVRATFENGETRDYPTVDLCETIRVDLR